MSARYQVDVSGELLQAWDTDLLPEGMRIVEIGDLDVVKRTHPVIFDDDGAPEELNGKIVYPWFQIDTVTRKVTIVGRDVVS